MPVKYEPYKSMYVSRRSPEIAQMLEQRFASNMAAQDELQQKLLELQSAPFEGDSAARAKLYNDTRTQLEQMAQRGDYENMTMQVAKLARNYENTAYPIAFNQKLFAEDQAAKQDQLAKGLITKDMYDKWVQSTQYKFDNNTGDYVRYTGIQFDQKGQPDPTSYYTPTQLAPFVDVQGEIISQLNDLEEVKSGGYTVKGYDRPGDGGIEYVITKQGQFVEKVPEQLVEQVTRGVLNRSDVRSYMEQDARFNVMTADENTLNSVLAKGISQMQASDDSATRQKAAELQRTLATGTLGQKRQAAQQVKYDQEYTSMFNMGMNVRTPSRYGGRNEIEYSPLYLAAVRAAGEKDGTDPTSEDRMLFHGADQTFISPFADPTSGVASPTSIQNRVETAMQNQITAVQNVQTMIPSLKEVPGDEILQVLSTMGPTELRQYVFNSGLNKRDAAIIEQARQAVQLQNAQIQAATEMQQLAYSDAGFTTVELPNQVIATALNDLETTEEMPEVFNSMLDGQNPEVAAAGIAARIHADIAMRRTPVAENDTLGLVSNMVQQITGFDEETSRRAASEGISSGYTLINAGPDPLTTYSIMTGSSATAGSSPQSGKVASQQIQLSSDLEALIDDIVKGHRELALARNSTFNTGLQDLSRGTINFPNIEFRAGTDGAKLAKDVRDYFKNNNIGIMDLNQAADMSGNPLATSLLKQLEIDPSDYEDYEEMLIDTKVENVQFTRALHSDGSVRPVLGFTFKYNKEGVQGGDRVSNSIKVPFEQIVKYDLGLYDALSQFENTPADAVLREVYTSMVAAPGVVTRKGVTTEYSDPNGNYFTFTFVPRIGANNVMQDFGRIEVTGYSAALGKEISFVYADEAEFIASFNTLIYYSSNAN